VVRLEEHGLGVRQSTAGAVASELRASRPQVHARGSRTVQRELELREEGKCASGRLALGEAAQARGGHTKVATRRVHPRESLQRVRVAGHGSKRGKVGVPGCARAPEGQLEVANQRLHIREAFRGATGGGREAHRTDRTDRVAGELAVIGHARVRGETRLEVHEPLDRARSVPVPAQLDLSVCDDCVGAREARRHTPGLDSETQLFAEVVAQACERPGADQRGEVARVATQRRAENTVSARVDRGVTGRACLGHVRLAEQRTRVRAVRCRPHGGPRIAQRIAGRASEVGSG
jgi:hypothetical protein